MHHSGEGGAKGAGKKGKCKVGREGKWEVGGLGEGATGAGGEPGGRTTLSDLLASSAFQKARGSSTAESGAMWRGAAFLFGLR